MLVATRTPSIVWMVIRKRCVVPELRKRYVQSVVRVLSGMVRGPPRIKSGVSTYPASTNRPVWRTQVGSGGSGRSKGSVEVVVLVVAVVVGSRLVLLLEDEVVKEDEEDEELELVSVLEEVLEEVEVVGGRRMIPMALLGADSPPAASMAVRK